jgi:hypothetical protein
MVAEELFVENADTGGVEIPFPLVLKAIIGAGLACLISSVALGFFAELPAHGLKAQSMCMDGFKTCLGALIGLVGGRVVK